MCPSRSRHSVRMRPADSPHPDFHLLEELSKPRACTSSGRISVWVYLDRSVIREIVLAGHAETQTCASATSIIIEAAKQLDDDVEWMLTCGAAYFRVTPGKYDTEKNVLARELGGLSRPAGLKADEKLSRLREILAGTRQETNTQRILGQMITDLQERGEETGLIDVIYQHWNELDRFRRRFYQRRGSPSAKIVLPDPGSAGRVADYLPIVPGSDPDRDPLIFTLEGWDFDCPEFQSVAERHLKKVQRELLKDAMRRRRTYRGWLKEWMEEWVPKLKWLCKEEAGLAVLEVPPSVDAPDTAAEVVDMCTFLKKHIAGFLDRGQDWYEMLSAYYEHTSFRQQSDTFLDELMDFKRVKLFDFERGTCEERPTTADDTRYSRREYILHHQPGMISTCLRYIRRMDTIIKPYQDQGLRLWQRVSGGKAPPNATRTDREAYIVADISRKIVMETMIRGWPSIYLDNEDDRAAFDAWSSECRPHVWSIIAKQAKKAGVPLELLLEDNIIYNVQFNEDLGCTVQPLMLADEASCAQIHGSRAGASAVVPLWSRHSHREMPQEILKLGVNNCERAEELVRKACSHTTGPKPDIDQAVRCLRLALACHPARAGCLILNEWLRRLGRNTKEEFELAVEIVQAREMCARFRNSEAVAHLKSYLNREPNPIQDAYVMLALCDLMTAQNTLPEYEEKHTRRQRLVGRLKEEVGADPAELSEENFQALVRRKPRLMVLLRELHQVTEQLKQLTYRVEDEEKRRRTLIESALQEPSSICRDYPNLALAVQKVPDVLRLTLKTNCRYEPAASEEMALRYADIGRAVEMRGLFHIVHALGLIEFRMARSPNEARSDASQEIRRLSEDIWLPREVVVDLRTLAEECSKGDMDHLYARQVCGVLQDVIQTCYMRIQDLLSSRVVISMPVAEILITRIHIAQTIDAKYGKALEMLLNAKVGLGRAISKPWTVLNRQIKELHKDSIIGFDPQEGTIYLASSGTRTALLQTEKITKSEMEYLSHVLEDTDLRDRISPLAPCLAEGILALEIEPNPKWKLWRDTMATIREELIFVLSFFGYEASLMPEYAPPKSEEGEQMARRMNELIPRLDPILDWQWSELGSWQKIVGPNVKRFSDEHD